MELERREEWKKVDYLDTGKHIKRFMAFRHID